MTYRESFREAGPFTATFAFYLSGEESLDANAGLERLALKFPFDSSQDNPQLAAMMDSIPGCEWFRQLSIQDYPAPFIIFAMRGDFFPPYLPTLNPSRAALWPTESLEAIKNCRVWFVIETLFSPDNPQAAYGFLHRIAALIAGDRLVGGLDVQAHKLRSREECYDITTGDAPPPINELFSLSAYDDVIDVLVNEGVEKFADSFDSLSESVETETARIKDEIRAERRSQLADLAGAYDSALESLASESVVEALQDGRAEFWSDDADVAREIDNLLGWLQTVPEMQRVTAARQFSSLATDVNRRGYDRLVLLGMGGSSLAPEVMANTLPAAEGFPQLTVLDTTYPDAIERARAAMATERTLFIVSSKSGTTVETATLFDYFLEANDGNADDFIVITDPGSPLEARARNLGVWKVFTNRHDIGGRFSALSYFGLVPAAGAGIDVGDLLDEAAAVLPVHDLDHPGIALGAAIGAAATSGRNKLTLLSSNRWASFGTWLEQLIAESTGKNGVGIVPVVGEAPRAVAHYGDDRIFAVIEDGDADSTALAESLRQAGQPVVSLPANLGQLFMVWEIATAVAGKLLGINPFDQPNVQSAKDQTNRILSSGSSSEIEGLDARSAIQHVLSAAGRGSYIAIQAFVDPTDDTRDALASLANALAEQTPAPVTVGIGPRFLHSSGQLHKGGAAQGVFLQLVQASSNDLDIPGREYSFNRLFMAQADGDYQALAERNMDVTRAAVGSAGDILAMARSVAATGVAAD